MSSAARAWGERVVPRIGAGLATSLMLRQPTGADELAVQGIDTRSATGLLDRLVQPPVPCAGLAASDRDALLAVLHRGLWGDRVASSLHCAGCGAMFDLEFLLSDLQRGLEAERLPARPVGERSVEAGDGVRFRLPSADEEEACAVAGGEDARRMLGEIACGQTPPDGLEERLEQLAPLIDVELEADCPECGDIAEVRFDIQTFTLQRLLDQRPAVLAEVHALASGYGWSLTEILGLDAPLRRNFAWRLG